MPLRALLFDFDGVLADTENIHVAAWQRTFAAMGWVVSDEVCARAAEEDDRDFLASIFATRKIEAGNIAGWVKRKQELTITMLRNAPRLYPGTAELIGGLRDRFQLAVVTGTWRANVEAVLEASGLAEAFALIVSKEDVAVVKPAPEAYRLALERLRLRASEAIALEDSPTGLEAARAAGLRCLAIGHRRSRGAWVGTAEFVPDLTQIPRTLERLDRAGPSNA
jgi:HAD superfamily hydrolase (TIGR01509 family)